MGTIASAILTTVLSFAADWLKGWYQAERAEADRWATRTREGQIASLKRAAIDQQATATAAAQAQAPATPVKWNVAAVLVLAAMALPGCFERMVYVPSAVPLVAVPARPAVPVEPTVWTGRERILVGYATALEAAISEHNRRAREANTANGY